MIVTPYFEEHLLNYAFRGVPMPGPTERYLSLWATTPPAGLEVTDANYTRVIVPFGAWSTSIKNSTLRLFPAAAAGFEFTFVAICDAVTGGNVLLYKNVNLTQVLAGQQVRLAAGAVTLDII